MSKRLNNLVLFLVITLLLCEITPAVTNHSSFSLSDGSSLGREVQGRSLVPIADTSFSELGTPELIRGHNYGPSFSIRVQTKGKESQRPSVRLLLLFVFVLCLLNIALRHLRYKLLLPEDAYASSNILGFIHNTDGKK